MGLTGLSSKKKGMTIVTQRAHVHREHDLLHSSKPPNTPSGLKAATLLPGSELMSRCQKQSKTFAK